MDDEVLTIDIRELRLSARTCNALLNAGVRTLHDLRELTSSEILSTRNIGVGGLQEITQALASQPGSQRTPFTALRDGPRLANWRSSKGGYLMCPEGDATAALEEFLPENVRATLRNVASEAATIPGAPRLVAMAASPLLDVVMRSGMPPRELLRFVGSLIEQAAQLRNQEHVSPIGELRLLLTEEKPRTARIMSLYYGWGPDEPKTLEEIGSDLGITRERVRQILNPLRKRLFEYRPPFSSIEAVFEPILLAAAPISVRQWIRQVPELIRPTSAELRTLVRMSQVGWTPNVTLVGEGKNALAIAGEGRESELSVIMQSLRPWLGKAIQAGVFSLAELSERTGHPPDLVLSVLRCHRHIHRVGSVWAVVKTTRSQVYRQIAMTLTELGPLPADELRRALLRRRQLWSRIGVSALPRKQWSRVVASLGFDVDKNGNVSLGADNPFVYAKGAESTVVTILKEHRIPLTAREVVRTASERGTSEPMCQSILNQSALIVRAERGVYTLRGTAVDPALLRNARRRRAAEPNSATRASVLRVDAIAVELEFPLHTASIRTLSIPTGVIARGPWTVDMGADTFVEIKVRSHYVTGLLPLARELAEKKVSSFRLTFRRSSRTVSVWWDSRSRRDSSRGKRRS